MLVDIRYANRKTGKIEKEEVYGGPLLKYLYGKGKWLLPVLCKTSVFSSLYGFLQERKLTRKKILPFIKHFKVDISEFLEKPEDFCSFNDFFIRRLKPSARPIDSASFILPADARYLVYPSIKESDGFFVKGKKFSLTTLLKDPELAKKYEEGAMVIARLAPVDYHRFHFPCDCTPSEPRLINGPLYSVNPIAIKQNVSIHAENKRMITHLETEHFGTILFIEVGATNVGSIHQTYTPNKSVKKGDEKGYFSFGGSSVILLFEPNRIQFDQVLIDNSAKRLETLAHFGQSLGKSIN